MASIWRDEVNPVPYDSEGSTFTVTHTASLCSSQCKISSAVAHALKCLGAAKPQLSGLIVSVCTADNFVNFSLWFGHVTRPQTVSPKNARVKERERNDCLWQPQSYSAISHGHFLFRPQLRLRRTHTNIRRKWLRKNHILFYSFI